MGGKRRAPLQDAHMLGSCCEAGGPWIRHPKGGILVFRETCAAMYLGRDHTRFLCFNRNRLRLPRQIAHVHGGSGCSAAATAAAAAASAAPLATVVGHRDRRRVYRGAGALSPGWAPCADVRSRVMERVCRRGLSVKPPKSLQPLRSLLANPTRGDHARCPHHAVRRAGNSSHSSVWLAPVCSALTATTPTTPLSRANKDSVPKRSHLSKYENINTHT